MENRQMTVLGQAHAADGYVLGGDAERSAGTCVDARLRLSMDPVEPASEPPGATAWCRLRRRPGRDSIEQQPVNVSCTWEASADFDGYSSSDTGLPPTPAMTPRWPGSRGS
jgi:hypothetical protein